MRAWVPRRQAVPNRMGSMKVCGRSFIMVGLDSRCSALDRGWLPPAFHAPDFFAGKAFAEHVLAHQVLMCGVHIGFGLDLVAKVAQHLHRALIGDMRPRRIGQPAIAVDDHVLGAIAGQQRRRCRPRGSGPDDQNIVVVMVAISSLPCSLNVSGPRIPKAAVIFGLIGFAVRVADQFKLHGPGGEEIDPGLARTWAVGHGCRVAEDLNALVLQIADGTFHIRGVERDVMPADIRVARQFRILIGRRIFEDFEIGAIAAAHQPHRRNLGLGIDVQMVCHPGCCHHLRTVPSG